MKNLIALCGITVTLVACRGAAPKEAPVSQPQSTDSEVRKLKTISAKFAPVDLGANVGALPPNEQQALQKMIEAARLMDAIFLRQVWSGNESMMLQLAGDGSDSGRARLENFIINKGPWARIDHNAPFV